MDNRHNFPQRVQKPYQDREWLLQEYVIFEREIGDIAGMCGASTTSVRKYLEQFDIPIRTKSTHWPLSYFWRNGPPKTPDWDEDERRHPSEWKPQTQDELYRSIEWRELKELVRERDGNTCQRCGENNKKMAVHHILPARWLIETLNHLFCILLCSGCHVWVHGYNTNTNMEFLASPIFGGRYYFDPRLYQVSAQDYKSGKRLLRKSPSKVY